MERIMSFTINKIWTPDDAFTAALTFRRQMRMDLQTAYENAVQTYAHIQQLGDFPDKAEWLQDLHDIRIDISLLIAKLDN
jgi:hypothetical protein